MHTRRTLRALLALISCLALLPLVLIAAPAAPAGAAGYGPGFDLGLGRLGAYVAPDGSQVYCLDPDRDRPLGPTDPGAVGGWGGLDVDALTRLNWVLHEYGQSADPVETAAVNLYVWSVAAAGQYGAHGDGDAYYSARAGSARPAVLAALAAIRAEAAGIRPVAPPTVTVTLDPDLTGRATVRDPGGAGGLLTLSGAVPVDALDAADGDGAAATGGEPAGDGAVPDGTEPVADGTEPVADGSVPVVDGAVVEFVATPAAGARVADVSAVARFGTISYPAAITVYETGAAQRLAGPAAATTAASARATAPLEFHPVIESAVSTGRLVAGESAVDRLSALTGPESPARWRPGSRVIARGTLYGPFQQLPTLAAEPPAEAPVAWTEAVELDGPGEHASGGSFRPAEPGHYTWVWTIAAGEQPAETPVPEGYRWSDDFGLPAETFEVVEPLPATGGGDPARTAAAWLGGAAALLLGGGLTLGAALVRNRRRPGEREAPEPSPERHSEPSGRSRVSGTG